MLHSVQCFRLVLLWCARLDVIFCCCWFQTRLLWVVFFASITIEMATAMSLKWNGNCGTADQVTAVFFSVSRPFIFVMKNSGDMMCGLVAQVWSLDFMAAFHSNVSLPWKPWPGGRRRSWAVWWQLQLHAEGAARQGSGDYFGSVLGMWVCVSSTSSSLCCTGSSSIRGLYIVVVTVFLTVSCLSPSLFPDEGALFSSLESSFRFHCCKEGIKRNKSYSDLSCCEE